MPALSRYFGDPARPVFGWIHLPEDGCARAGVVLCSSLAVEEMCSHPALRSLAEELAAIGIASVRFDYPGTGDSAGELDGGADLASWVASIGSAIALLRRAGVGSIGLLGLRLGALLAARAAALDGRIEALVLWDPPANGRGFLREQRALRTLSVDAAPLAEGGMELLGLVLPTSLAAELGVLDLGELEGSSAKSTLAVLRAERPLPPLIAQHLGASGATVVEREGQDRFIDVLPDESVIPLETLRAMVEWLGAALPTAAKPVELPPLADRLRLLFGPPPLLEERPCQFGPFGLFGIETSAAGECSDLTVVLLNAGLLRHTGPARLWVTLARRLAADGFRVLRMDLSGLGDSPARPGRPRQQSYPLDAVEDVAHAVRFAAQSGDPGEVVLAGLCAGAYHSIEAGLALGVRAVCAINPLLAFDPADYREPGAPSGEVAASQPYRPWIRRLREIDRLRRFAERSVPPVVWWLLDRSGVQPAPGRGPASLVASGSELLLVCGEAEAPQFLRRSPAQWRALQRSPRFAFSLLEDADHALLGADARRRATDIVLAHARSQWSPGAARNDLERDPVS